MGKTTSPNWQPQECNAKTVLLGDERLDNPLHVFHLIERGIPVRNAVRALTVVGVIRNEQIVAKLVEMSSRTLRRAARDSQRVLSRHQSACVWHFLSALSRAERIIGPHQLAQGWIAAPSLGLNGYAPIDLLINPAGYEIVSDFLTRLEYGVYG